MSQSVWALGVAAAFVGGFGAAWFVKPAPTLDSAGHSSSEVPPRIRDRPSEHASQGGRDFDEMLIKLRENQHRSEEFQQAFDELGDAEIPGFLESLAKRAGLSGLSWEDESLMQDTLKRWYEENPEAAISWVMALENRDDCASLLTHFVDLEAEQDLASALSMLRSFNAQLEESIGVPYGLQQKGADLGVETLLQVFELGLKDENGASGTGLRYPSGFDFGAALRGLVELEANAPEGHELSSVPSNLLAEWAKRDPQAALDWAQEGHELSFNSGLGEFFEGYAEVASDEEYGTLVAELFDPEDDSVDPYGEAWSALSEVADEEVIRHFTEHASDHATAREHIEGLIVASMGSSGGSYDTTRGILLSMLTADERRNLLTSGEYPRFQRGFARNQLAPDLERLGHTPAEIDEMLPPEE